MIDNNIYGRGVLALGDRIARRVPRGQNDAFQSIPGAGTPLTLNPVAIGMDWRAGPITPHGFTTRLNYKVPTGRRGNITSGLASAYRQAAAVGPGTVISHIEIRRKGQANSIELCKALFNDNNINITSIGSHPGPFELFEGDEVFFETLDSANGGAVTYVISCSIIEFDAVDHSKSIAITSNQGANSPIATQSSANSGGGTITSQPILTYVGGPGYDPSGRIIQR